MSAKQLLAIGHASGGLRTQLWFDGNAALKECLAARDKFLFCFVNAVVSMGLCPPGKIA